MADNGGVRRRAGRRWLWICAGIAAAGAVAAVLGIWHLPDRMYPGGEVEMGQARAALQGGLLTAAAALTAVAGGLIALDETRQANTETRRANAASDTRERAANLNTHVRELYVEAAKLLNDPDNLGVRLAGIYALERIAVDSPADQRTVVEVLSAFVRTRSTDPALRPPPSDGQEPPPLPLAADIRAAVQVLGRLPVLDDVPRCDLTGADLTGHASITGLTLTDANLTGAVLDGANLTDVRLDEANLTRADLYGATLTRARLSGATLTGARLSGATLTRAWLSGANLTYARLGGANLTYARLDKANLTGADLSRANLTDVRLGEANLTDVRLGEANLTGAWLGGATGLSTGQVMAASGDTRTLLPEGVARPGSWPPYDRPPDPWPR